MNPRESAASAPAAGTSSPPMAYEFAGFRLEPRKRQVTNPAGESVAMTSKAYEALLYLVQRAGELVPRAALTQALWPSTIVEDNNLNQAIAALRRAIGDRHIATVPGRGYQFVTPVSVVEVGATPPSERFPQQLSPLPPAGPPTQAQPKSEAHASEPASRRRGYLLAVIGLVALTGGLGYWLRDGGSSAPSQSLSRPLGPVSQVTSLTAFPGNETSPHFAPDGVRIAYAGGESPEATDIYVTQAGGSQPLRLTEEGTNRDPAWSPDGTQIAFLRQHGPTDLDLMVVPALGGPARVLRPVHMYFISREGSPLVAWTRDSKELLFTTRREGEEMLFDLSAYSLETGKSRALGIPQQPGDYDTSPAFSPDGNRLAFVRFRAGNRMGRLLIQNLAPGLVPQGTPFELPGQGKALAHSPAWSKDGRLLRFAMGDRIMEWNGSALRSVQTLGAAIGSMSIHDDSGAARAVVSLIRSDLDIYALPLDPRAHVATGRPEVLVKSTSFESHPRFSPDGRRLAFVSGRSGRPQVWVAEADGKQPRQLTFVDAAVVGFPRWSPDGSRIAFHTSNPNGERLVYLVDTNDGTVRELGPGCCPSWWSADGQFLYVGDMGSTVRIARIRLADAKRESLFEGDLAVESADRKQILYSKGRERGIFARSLEGDLATNPETRLVEDYTPTLGATIPVSTGFYYIGHDPDGRPRAFRFYDYASKAAKDVAPAPVKLTNGMTLSADGTRFLYAADESGAGSDLALLEFGE